MSGDMQNHWARLLVGDVRERLATINAGSVQTCVTSPPYWGLRAYLKDDHPSKAFELGSEKLHDCCGWATGSRCGECFICHMVDVFDGVKRVLRDDGTLWVNLGDSYASDGKNRTVEQASANSTLQGGLCGQLTILKQASKVVHGLKQKDLVGIPWRFALAMQAAGWYLRAEIVWHKPNGMPGSQQDRPTRNHEQVFLFSKQQRYFYDSEAVKESSAESTGLRLAQDVEQQEGSHRANGGAKTNGAMKAVGDPTCRTLRSVWTIPTESFTGSHFAVFPQRLVELPIRAGTSERGCCASCGSPWVRVVEKERKATRPAKESKVYEPNGSKQDALGKRQYTGFNERWDAKEAALKSITNRVHHDAEVVGNRDPERHVTESRTVGWEAGCDCQADVVPCLVLDPFAGAGTTGLVSRKLARRFVGTELNEEYAAMAWRRMNAHPKPDVPQVKPCAGQFELFPA